MSDPIYLGIASPFTLGATQVPEPAVNEEAVRHDLEALVLMTSGERIMRPDLGGNAYSYVFENDSEARSRFIRAEVNSTIAKYEPRVVVTAVDVVNTEDNRGNTMTIITIKYLIPTLQLADQAQVTLPTATAQTE